MDVGNNDSGNLIAVILSINGVTSLTRYVVVTAVTGIVKDKPYVAIEISNPPRFSYRYTNSRSVLGDHPVHTSVKVSGLESFLFEIRLDFGISPVSAASGPLNTDSGTLLNSSFRRFHEGLPKLSE